MKAQMLALEVPVKVFDTNQLTEAQKFANQTGGHLYTHVSEGNRNTLLQGVHVVNRVAYVVIESAAMLPDFFNLPNDTPPPFDVLDEGDAVAIGEIARQALCDMDSPIQEEMDLADEEWARLRETLTTIMENTPYRAASPKADDTPEPVAPVRKLPMTRTEMWDTLAKEGIRPNGITDRRLLKLKTLLLNSEGFWQDIRAHGFPDTPLDRMDKHTRDHLIGNFWGMVVGAAYRHNILKP